MNKYTKEQEQKFLELRVQGKSLKSIENELNIPIDTLLEWDFEFSDDVHDAKSLEYDRLIEEKTLSSIQRFKYLTELYVKLKEELDKRDFSGLPTDKLYIVFNDVYERIQNQLNSEDNYDWYNDEDFDASYKSPEDLD